VRDGRRDEGSILPLVMVMSVVLTVVITALASYVSSGLRYGTVVEERADRLAAADGGLRYALERLGNSQYAACLSHLGSSGYTIDFPVEVNGATVDVTCRRGGGGIGDVKAWAIVVTGQGVPSGQPMLESQAGGGVQKMLGGPVWVSDPSRMDLKAPVTVEDGDIWYYRPDCDNPSPAVTLDEDLTFEPAYRGTICVNKPWTSLFRPPTIGSFPSASDVSLTNQPADTATYPGCSVFEPGRYTVMPALGAHNYFKSGNYYFEDVQFEVEDAVVTAGWPDSAAYGDQIFIPNAPCAAAITDDAASGSTPGATFYFGGTSHIDVDNKGSFEIMRRLQGDSLVSIQALHTSSAGSHKASSLTSTSDLIWTKSGANNDLALHGLVWAPRASMTFGNVTNAANGQILGGAVFARMHLQASASASAFVIRVETAPIAYELRVDATAAKNGRTTTMTAVVQVSDQGVTAVNSLRVRE
jgi:hypothetical protein